MEDNYVDNMISRMQAAGKASGDVICHPLMSIAGDHANNDMKGGVSENDPEEGSWRYQLNKTGYTCPLSNCDIKGLADYSEIVNVCFFYNFAVRKLQRVITKRKQNGKD